MNKAIFLLAILVLPAYSRTKLTTLPERNKIRLDLKNQNFSLVEEERTINLQKGNNQVEFAWANTQIDKATIQIRCLRSPGIVKVLNTNYPPKETALFWQVYANKAGPGVFRISYLIYNLNKNISYEAIANTDESHLQLRTFFLLRNQTGERFKNASVQINFGPDFKRTFEAGEGKKMLAAKFHRVPIIKKYIFDPQVETKNVRMYYILANHTENALGRFPLPAGKVRIFQEDRRGSEAFLGEDWGGYTPVGREMSLYLGQANEVKVKRFVYNNDETVVREPIKQIHRTVKFQVQNFKKSPITLNLVEHINGGEWSLDKVELKQEIGERNKRREIRKSSRNLISTEKFDIKQMRVAFKAPPVTDDKYNIYLHFTLKNRW